MAMRQVAAGTVEALPQRLRNFFARYPPQFYSAQAILKQPRIEQQQGEGATDTNAPASLSSVTPALNPYASRNTKVRTLRTTTGTPATPTDPNSTTSYTDSLLRSHPDSQHPNPFLPFKNPETGHWRGSAISLRRQADLVKLAKHHGVEELLPPGRKGTEYKWARLVEKGLRIKGTGVGQVVKGHKWERNVRERLEERKKAMLEMPKMIRQWKQRGHGRGWKKYPHG